MAFINCCIRLLKEFSVGKRQESISKDMLTRVRQERCRQFYRRENLHPLAHQLHQFAVLFFVVLHPLRSLVWRLSLLLVVKWHWKLFKCLYQSDKQENKNKYKCQTLEIYRCQDASTLFSWLWSEKISGKRANLCFLSHQNLIRRNLNQQHLKRDYYPKDQISIKSTN